ncbi:MAG: AsmA family protein [Gammaproteobacteria bacterium]|nr:AsmA family protein [Gammaproteobacteria bacterium]
MHGLTKTLSWLCAVLLVLLIAISAAVTLLFDPNDYKADIEALIEAETGRQVSIEGDLSLSLLPCCAVEAGRMTLGNPAGFEGQDFLVIDSASVSIQLLPLLLSQEVKLGDVVLQGVEVTLITRSNGSVNWSFDDNTQLAAGTSPESRVTEGSELTSNQLSVAGLSFTDGRLRWIDEISGDDIFFRAVNVVTGPVVLGESFDLAADFGVEGLPGGMDAKFVYQGSPVISPNAVGVDLGGSRIEVVLSSNQLPNGIASLTIVMPELLLGSDDAVVTAKGATLELSTGPLALSATVEGAVNSQGTSFSGTLNLSEFSPRELLRFLGTDIETADLDVLAKMSMMSDWSYRNDRVGLSNLVANIDDTTIAGELGLGSIQKQQILADLNLDRINLDRYLVPAEGVADSSAEGAGKSTSSSSNQELLPVELLRPLNMQASFRVGELAVANVMLRDVVMSLVASDGRLRVNPLRASLYEGQYSGDIRLNLRGEEPQIAMNENLSDIQIGLLLLDMKNIQNIEGEFEAKFQATSSGNTEAELIAGLNGGLSFELQEGIYQGRDFWYELRSQKARLSGDPQPPAPENPKTDISRLFGSGVVTNGVLQNNDFIMQLPFVRLNGAGQADLNQMQLNYRLNAKVIGSPEFDDGSNLDELKGLTLPVTISGSAAEPDVVIDLTSVIAGLATKKIQDRLLKKYGGKIESSVDKDSTTDGSSEENEAPSEREARKKLLEKGIRGLFN